MKKSFLILVVFITLFSSCKKNSNEFCDAYISGEIVIGTKENVKLEEIFSFINENKYKIISSFGARYECSLPSDSLAYVNRILKSKEYFNKNGWIGKAELNYQTNKIICINQMMDMDINSQNDWINTIQQLQLIQTNNVTTFLLSVKKGKEKEIVRLLKNNSLLKWAELNCLANAELL